MRKKLFIISIIAIISIVCGCVDAPSSSQQMTGRYYLESDPTAYIQFQGDKYYVEPSISLKKYLAIVFRV